LRNKSLNIDFLLIGGVPPLLKNLGEVRRKLNLQSKYCGDEEIMEQILYDMEKVQREINSFENKCVFLSRTAAAKNIEIWPKSEMKINQSKKSILNWIQETYSTRIQRHSQGGGGGDISLIYIIYLGYGKKGTGDWCCSGGEFISLQNILEIVRQETRVFFQENKGKERFFPLLPKIFIFSDACNSASWATKMGEALLATKTSSQDQKLHSPSSSKNLNISRSHTSASPGALASIEKLDISSSSTSTTSKREDALPLWYNIYDHIAILGSATESSIAGAWFRDIEVMDEDINFVKRVIFRHQTPKYYEGRSFTALMNDETFVKRGGLGARLNKLSWLFKMNQVVF
jgi:hypothetical protein